MCKCISVFVESCYYCVPTTLSESTLREEIFANLPNFREIKFREIQAESSILENIFPNCISLVSVETSFDKDILFVVYAITT